MQKFYVEIPYSCTTYGRVKGFIYAESQSEAEEKAYDIDNMENPEYIDHDTDNTEHYYSDMEIELRESNVPEDDIPEYIRELQTR